ncbi:hypothetical protein D3C72_1426230 [compost metagenome]
MDLTTCGLGAKSETCAQPVAREAAYAFCTRKWAGPVSNLVTIVVVLGALALGRVSDEKPFPKDVVVGHSLAVVRNDDAVIFEHDADVASVGIK